MVFVKSIGIRRFEPKINTDDVNKLSTEKLFQK